MTKSNGQFNCKGGRGTVGLGFCKLTALTARNYSDRPLEFGVLSSGGMIVSVRWNWKRMKLAFGKSLLLLNQPSIWLTWHCCILFKHQNHRKDDGMSVSRKKNLNVSRCRGEAMQMERRTERVHYLWAIHHVCYYRFKAACKLIDGTACLAGNGTATGICDVGHRHGNMTDSTDSVDVSDGLEESCTDSAQNTNCQVLHQPQDVENLINSLPDLVVQTIFQVQCLHCSCNS